MASIEAIGRPTFGSNAGSLARLDRTLSGFAWQKPKSDSIYPSSSSRSEDHKGPLGLTLLHEPLQAQVDLVFVHGLGGGSRKTWCKTTKPEQYWPKEWLSVDKGFEFVRIHAFGYKADWGEKRGSLSDIHDFGHSLLGELHNSPTLRKDATPIILVGHSMGGIVIKKAYILARQDPSFDDIAQRFHSFYFLATPHRGSDLTKTLTNILKVTFGQKPYVNDLERNSSTIAMVNDTFRHYASDVKLWSFYETIPSDLKVTNVTIVDKSSATLGYSNERIVPLNADHRGVCKFIDTYDPTYITIRNALCNTVDSIIVEATPAKVTSSRDNRRRLEEFLGNPEIPEDDLSTLLDCRHTDSCAWLAQRPDFVDWECSWSRAPPVLWLTGHPATGKSVLCGHVVEYLQQRNSSVAYFFFRHGRLGRQTISACLRSLAYQMAFNSESVRQEILDLAQNDISWDFEDEKATWRKLFVNGIFCRDTAEPQYWVIDAVDEAVKSEQLIRLIPHLPKNVRLFVTSRNTQDIENAISGVSRFVKYKGISSSETMIDIRSLVSSKMDMIPAGANEHLRQKIMEKSAGCFLWVRLVLQELEYCYTEEAVEEALEEIPSDMNALYSRMLRLLPSSPRALKLAKSILTWVVCAPRPLTIIEMQCAIKLDINETTNNLEKSIASICGQLVTVDSLNRVQAIHQTALDFLSQQSIDSSFAVNKKSCHTRLVTLLLSYLTGEGLQAPGHPTMRRPSRQGVAGNPGLSDYAVHFFSYHLSKCHSSDNGAMKNLGSFLNSKILAWIEHVAKNGDLSPFSRTAADLKTYLNRRERHVPPTDPNMQTAEAWTTDLVRIAGKFGKYLLASPSSIHSLIPSLCPSASVIRRAFFNPNRSLIVKGIAAQDWDDCLARLDFPDGQALAIAHGESVFAVGLSNGFVEVFSKAILQLKKRLSHGERVKTLNFGKQDRYIASGGSRKICLWDAKNYTLIWSEKQDCQILALQFASNDYLLGITQRHEMVSWATESPHEDQERRLTIPLDFPMENKPKQPPTKALFSTDQRFFVLAYRAQAPFLFETETASVLSRLNRENGSPYPNAVLRHEVDVEALAFNPNPDLDLLIVSYGDGELVTFNLELYQACHRVPGVYAHTLACSPDGGTLVSGSSRGTIQVFEFDGVRGDNLTPIYRIDAFEDGIRGITFGSESNRFLDVRSSQCRVWEPPMLVRRGGAEGSQSEMTLSMPLQPRTVGMLEGPPDPEITSVLSSHDGGRAICGKQDGSIIVHSTSDAKQIAKAYSHHPNVSVTCLALTESDAVLISADESGRILVQQTPSADLSNPAELLADERFDRAVLALLVNHGGNRLLVCGADHLELRELPSGRKLNDRFFDVQHPLRAMRHPLYQEHLIVFENDVARLLQWSDFGEVSTPGGMRLSRFTEFPRNGAALTTSYNGYHILTELAKVTGHRSNSRFECWNASEFETSTQSVITLSGFKLLGPKIEQMIAVIGNTLIFLDTDLWICSLDLKMFEAMPVMKRHFFVLSEWLTMSGELLCNFTRKREFVIAKKHELVIVKHGMDFAETLELSTATKLWTLSQGSMHRKTSYNLST